MGRHGYHHGPIPNNNADWNPNGDITADVNADAPNAAEVLSGFNGRVCDVAVDGNRMDHHGIFSNMVGLLSRILSGLPAYLNTTIDILKRILDILNVLHNVLANSQWTQPVSSWSYLLFS
jgi:hypothetical protein